VSDTHADWLAARRLGIGGSDVAAIFGVSPWTDAFSLWLDKRGELPDDDNEAMQRGRVLEPALREAHAHTYDVLVRESPLVVGPEPWQRANPDGLIGEDGGWEGKTAVRPDGWGEDGAETTTRANALMPPYYALQVAWYLEVTGREWWAVTVAFVPYEADRLIAAMLRRGIDEETIGQTILDVSELRHYRVTRDRDFGRALVARCGGWWQRHVVEGEPPELTGSKAAHAWLGAQYPDALEPMRPADEDEAALLEALRAATDAAKAADRAKSTAQAQVKQAIGNAEGLFADGGRVTWRTQAGRKTIDGKRLRAERPEIADEYTRTGAPARVLRATWKGER